MTADRLAISIREIVPSAFRSFREDPVLIGDGEWRELPVEEPDLRPIREHATRVVRELDHILRESNWQPDFRPSPNPQDGSWTLGSVEQRGALRKIHHGYLEPVRRFVVLDGVPDLVVAFLARIPGWDEYVKRENHPGVGWHYHYLPQPSKRSDVLLAWDTRWQAPSPPPANKPPPPRPFLGEKHAEGRADVHAKPWLWGDKKKWSMYEVCARDLDKWGMHEFRCASNHAKPVWPAGVTVTPRASAGTKKP